MSLYLAPKVVRGTVAIAICDRCGMKLYNGDLVKDPNNGLRVCVDCKDDFDPYRLPARRTENVALDRPRPDEELE